MARVVLTDDMCREALRLMAEEGYSLNRAAQKVGVPYMTISDRLETPAWAVKYAHAREERGCFYGERIGDVARKCEDGEINPKAAAVAIQGYLHTASRMNRKLWGDKQVVDHNVNGNVTVAIDLSSVLGNEERKVEDAGGGE